MKLADRFWAKVDRTGDCWLWTGAIHATGYGVINLSRKTGLDHRWRLAHRIAYQLAFGPIPEGLQIDHVCRNRACVRPTHLEAVTHRENLLRGEGIPARNVALTQCPAGHPYDDENTYHPPGQPRSRMCRACRRARDRDRARRRSERSNA